MDQNDFKYWLMVTALPHHSDHEKLAAMQEATDSFQSVTITMQVNGIEIDDAEKFVDRMYKQYRDQVMKDAADLLEQHTSYDEAQDIFTETMDLMRKLVRKQMSLAGFELPDPE